MEMTFAPMGQLSALLPPNASTLDFTSDYSIRDGAVATSLAKLSSAGRDYGFSGKVLLDGTLDYNLDVKAWFKGHRDGERILKALGNTQVIANLRGTVDAPRLALPRFEQLAAEALRNTLQERAQTELQKALDRFLRRRK